MERCGIKGDKIMQTIGIITTSSGGSGTFACNYGAALQGYALVKQLRLLGFDAYDMNYISDNEYRPQQYNIIKRTLLRLPLLFKPYLVKQKIWEYKNRNSRRINRNSFVKFIEENHITHNNGTFYHLSDLKRVTANFYAVITGSDVVWNPLLHKNVNDRGYFLDFVPKGVKRIAYAPSFGVTELPDTAKVDLGELLRKFDAISVREKSGADLIRRETGLEVQVVLDPTLLLEPKYYEEVTKIPENLPKEYIAVYRFGEINHTKEKIREISKKYGLPIVYIPSNNDGAFEPDYSIGPGEFIGVIKNAKLVLSDSFHCTVFAIISHTPFLTFYRTMPEPGKDINSRMIDLLKMVHMSDRLVKPNEEIADDTLFTMDFSKSDMTICKLREQSLKYLMNALEL